MEIYNKKFVYFDWDKELDGKKGFVAQNIASLKSQVNNNPKTMVTLSGSDDDVCPFTYYVDNEITCDYQFAYYDPYYEVKKALLEGKTIQYYRKEFNEWTDLYLICSVEDYLDNEDWDIYEWRIKPMKWHVVLSDEGTLGIAKSTDKHIYFTGDDEECKEWIDEHEYLTDIMKAWEEGKTIQYYHNDDWRDVANNIPLWGTNDTYRVKPDKVEHVPFDNLNELITKWESMNPGCINRPECTMPMIWVKSKITGCVYLIGGYDYKNNEVCICEAWVTLRGVFSDFTFLDNSIIGKVKVQ